MKIVLRGLLAAISMGWIIGSPLAAAPAPALDVDVALVLVVDVSDSVQPSEFELQRLGIAAAFRTPELIAAIEAGALGRIAVTMVEFSDQAVQVGAWQTIEGAESGVAFAAFVIAASRSVVGQNTSISAGLTKATQVLSQSPYRATRLVIDISGDGANNADDFSSDISMGSAQAAAKKIGATVNGLPITAGGDLETLEFYQQWVVAGPSGFLIEAAGFEDFARAIRRKLILEIS